MNEKILEWITKITNSFAECSCGEMCHIDVTIRKRDILFRAICPNCRTVYSHSTHILLVSNANVDLTDYIIEDVRRGLKRPLQSVKNCNE